MQIAFKKGEPQRTLPQGEEGDVGQREGEGAENEDALEAQGAAQREGRHRPALQFFLYNFYFYFLIFLVC